MKKKTICIISQSYYPQDTRIKKYVDLLLDSGFKVDLITLKRKDLQKKENLGSLKIYRGGLEKKRASLFRYLLEYLCFFFYVFFKVTILFLNNRYRLIHVNTLPDFLVFSTIIPKIYGSKIILDLHEIAPEFFMVKFNKSENHFLICTLRFIEKLSMRFASHNITVSEAIKKIFARII